MHRPFNDGANIETHVECDTEWHRTIVEEVNGLSTVLNPDGAITDVSPAVTRILRTGPDELVGHNGYEFVQPDDRDRDVEAIELLTSDGSDAETVEVRFRAPEGSRRWIESTIRNRLDEDVDGVRTAGFTVHHEDFGRRIATLVPSGVVVASISPFRLLTIQ